MSDVVIRVENLSKLYRLGELHKQTNSFRDRVTQALSRLAPKNRRSSVGSHPSNTSIWALKNISFDVKQGDVLGIIGRNGAGKSTLLKILSRITKPTEGKAWINGRVGSLLEVGTGFHQELTGRENVFLNGAVLGMRRAEIEQKFDEIVAFSEIEKFIDTPVKRYSSGMQVRLAFAVAAHLEPEILLIDEVLAVGDANFQKKCLGKMSKVAKEGRTVLFVSHNMSSIVRLCDRTILLNEGCIVKRGLSIQVVNDYLRTGLGTKSKQNWPDINKAPGNDIVRLRAVRVLTEDGQIRGTFDVTQKFGIEMEYEVLKPGHILVPNFHFNNAEGLNIFVSADSASEWKRCPRKKGHYVSTAWISANFLAEGTIVVGAAISTMDPVVIHFHEQDLLAFQVIDTMKDNPTRGDYAGTIPGIVRPLLKWNTKFSANRDEACCEGE